MRTLPSRRFSPRVEVLENRLCPACTISVSGSTLRITGDGAANRVFVGHNGAGGVTATCDTAGPRVAAGITKIIIDTRGGDDFLLVGLSDSNLTTPLELQVALGSGADSFNMGVADINAELKVKLDLGSGDDFFDVELLDDVGAGRTAEFEVEGRGGRDRGDFLFDDVLEGATLEVEFDGGDGDDRFRVDGDDVNAGAELDVDFDGDDGDDEFQCSIPGQIGTGAKVEIDGEGGDDDDDGDDTMRITIGGIGVANIAAGAELDIELEEVDTLTATFAGVVNGTLEVEVESGEDDDMVDVDITVTAGSTGTVRATVNGEEGDDTLNLDLTDSSGGTADVQGTLDGGADFDTCTVTGPVTVQNCEA
jgi:hypothetical protein